MGAKRVVVVGSGPAGSAAALELSRRGAECVILERKSLPRTKACGSGLSPWTLKLLDDMGVGARVRAQAYRIDGAVISASNGERIELRGDHETAILRRSEFDYLLVQEAIAAGAELRDSTTVKSIVTDVTRSDPGCIAVTTTEGTIEADLLIDASGATGQLERLTKHTAGDDVAAPSTAFASSWPGKLVGRYLDQIRERTERERCTLHTIMGWYENVADCSDVVELFFDEELRPHYAWIFPETKERVNIGLCFLPQKDGPNAREHFESFLSRRLERRLRGAQLLGKWIGHPVHVSPFPEALVTDGVLRAGEAGYLADAATAEGIYHALLSGRAAGRFAARHLLANGRTDRRSLAPYQRAVQEGLTVRLLLGRGLMSALRTPTLDWALSMKSSKFTQKALSRAFTGLYHG